MISSNVSPAKQNTAVTQYTSAYNSKRDKNTKRRKMLGRSTTNKKSQASISDRLYTGSATTYKHKSSSKNNLCQSSTLRRRHMASITGDPAELDHQNWLNFNCSAAQLQAAASKVLKKNSPPIKVP